VSGRSTGAAGAGRRGAPASVGGACPPPVTRGESVAADEQQRAKVDWLNATFPAPSLSPEGFLALLGRMLGRPISSGECRGLLGFREGVQLLAHHGSERSVIGHLAWGGEGQGGRWLFQLTGHGCAFVTDWPELADLLDSLGARITRCDLAVDFLHGEHTVDDAVDVYLAGGFTSAGRRPTSSTSGDWIDGIAGRTFYVGKATNGKMLRVYEKGRQLGDPGSEWVRFEVQLGNRDREIPLDVLADPDAFFAGAYPALADLLEDAARTIPTRQAEGEVTLGHLLHHLRRCYGKTVHALVAHTQAQHAELIEAVRVTALPRRLNPSSAAAGVEWADVHAQFRRVQKCA
jgi:phage replication initiation protein